MRPHPVVLCVAMDENELGRMVFLLQTRGYATLRAGSLDEALEQLKHAPADVLLAKLPLEGFAEGVARARALQPELQVVAVTAAAGYDRECPADAYLPAGGNKAADILDRVKILTGRKRGPKPVSGPAAGRVAA